MPPSPFVIQWVPIVARTALPGARALDLAMGEGRHVGTLVRAGYKVFGVDRSFDAVRRAQSAAAGTLRAWCADLASYPLPSRRFDLVLVTRYLDRSWFARLRETVAPGGVVMYETFTIRQRARGWGPTSPNHLLEPGELRGYFEGFEILHWAEHDEPEAVASIAARRPV